MAKVAAAGGAQEASRLDRRKARTRQALIDAAVRLIAEGRGERASIAEITEEAGIGFGSFYNHFGSKEQLFGTASGELLEQWGQVIDQACADISDPAEVFVVSLRISGRLGWTHPDIARFLTGAGLESLDASRGLAPRALRDIRNEWMRHPWTSSPRPACGCSAFPLPKPPVSSRPACPLSGRSAVKGH